MNTHFNKRCRHSQLAQPRDQKATLVSRSAYFSQSAGAERETSALTRGAGGKGLGESGTRWGRINSKTRHRDHKKETGGERPSGDSSCFDSRQLPQWDGEGQDLLIGSLLSVKGQEEMNVPFVRLLLGGMFHYTWLLTGLEFLSWLKKNHIRIEFWSCLSEFMLAGP